MTIVPQGHYGHSKTERKISILKETLEKSELRFTWYTFSGWTCVTKLIERAVNSIPIGYLLHLTGAANPLLWVLTPNSLRLISSSDRSPIGMFKIRNSGADLISDIEHKYSTWYQIFNNAYLPFIMQCKKWHLSHENLIVRDEVYFKLTESKMGQYWRAIDNNLC